MKSVLHAAYMAYLPASLSAEFKITVLEQLVDGHPYQGNYSTFLCRN